MSDLELLEPGETLGEGRFVLSRVLARGREGLLYVATAPGDPRPWVVKELDPALARQAERLSEVRLQRVASAQAPVLSEGRSWLVREYVDGFPVSALARLRREPMGRDAVLEEMLRLVEDLRRLEQAGLPVSPRVLDPEHVLIDRSGRLRPVNPLPDPEVPAEGGAALCGRVGDLVCALVPDPPPDLAWFVSRCQGYRHLEQVERALRELCAPPEPEAPPPEPRRRRWLPLVAALPLAALGLFLARAAPAPLPERVAMVAYPDRLEVRDAETLALVSTLRGSPVGALVALRPNLLAAAVLPSGLALFRPGADPEPVVPARVADLASDPSGRWLATLEASQGVVSLQPVEPLLGHPPRSRGAVVAVSGREVRMAVGRARGARWPPLFVADPGRSTLTRYQLNPTTLAAEVPLGEVGALALTSEGASLDVALPARSEVRRLDAATLEPRGPSARIPGRPRFLVPLREDLAVLDESGGLTFLDGETLEPEASLALGGRPVAVSGSLWVATERDLLALDPEKRRVRLRTPLSRSPSGLAVVSVPSSERRREPRPPGG